MRKAKVASLRKFLRGKLEANTREKEKSCAPIRLRNSYLESLEPIHVSRKILDNDRGSAIPTWKAWGQFML